MNVIATILALLLLVCCGRKCAGKLKPHEGVPLDKASSREEIARAEFDNPAAVPAAAEPFLLELRTLTGERILVETSPAETIAAVKDKIYLQQGIPPAEQRLVLGNAELADGQTVRTFSGQYISNPSPSICPCFWSIYDSFVARSRQLWDHAGDHRASCAQAS